MARPQRFFFVHVMKTAGTSFLVHHAGPAFDESETFPNRNEDNSSYAFDRSDYWRVGALADLDEERRARTRLYRGHFPWCATELVDGDGLITLTMLRHPVDRVISYLKHCRTYHPQHADMSLEEIYREPGWIDSFGTNHQTKVFSLTWDDDPQYSYQPVEIDQRRLVLAKENLEKVDLLGVQERFGALVDECGSRFGWPTERRPMHRRSDEVAVSDALRRRIEHDNEIDLELYEFAAARGL